MQELQGINKPASTTPRMAEPECQLGSKEEERPFWEDQLDYDGEPVQAESPNADHFHHR